MSEHASDEDRDPDPHKWHRFGSVSVWEGPHITLIVVEDAGAAENWQWGARGWQEPEEAWSEICPSREWAEREAIKWYVTKAEA